MLLLQLIGWSREILLLRRRTKVVLEGRLSSRCRPSLAAAVCLDSKHLAHDAIPSQRCSAVKDIIRRRGGTGGQLLGWLRSVRPLLLVLP